MATVIYIMSPYRNINSLNEIIAFYFLFKMNNLQNKVLFGIYHMI
jgi:hypothetical protein